MANKINIKCSRLDNLGVYLNNSPHPSISLRFAKLQNGHNIFLDAGDYLIELTAQFEDSGVQVDCVITGASGTTRQCVHHINADGRLAAFCAFVVLPNGSVQ